MSGPGTVLGLDLAGPAGSARTAGLILVPSGTAWEVAAFREGLSDADILAWMPEGIGVVGLDAPLSYPEGEGSRPADRAARARARDAGLAPATVMAPLAPRMVYLTLRGLGLSRLLMTARPGVRLVEVHPALALALRGLAAGDVRALKRSATVRRRLLAGLERLGVQGAARLPAASDHLVAAAAAALAAADWAAGRPRWCHPADPPHHPYDFAA